MKRKKYISESNKRNGEESIYSGPGNFIYRNKQNTTTKLLFSACKHPKHYNMMLATYGTVEARAEARASNGNMNIMCLLDVGWIRLCLKLLLTIHINVYECITVYWSGWRGRGQSVLAEATATTTKNVKYYEKHCSFANNYSPYEWKKKMWRKIWNACMMPMLVCLMLPSVYSLTWITTHTKKKKTVYTWFFSLLLIHIFIYHIVHIHSSDVCMQIFKLRTFFVPSPPSVLLHHYHHLFDEFFSMLFV